MAKSIHKKEYIDKFNIGFEFEFYVKNKNMKTKEVVPPDILKKYGHLMNVKKFLNYKDAGDFFINKMKQYYPDTDWRTIFKSVDDGSLNGKVGYTSVEMVLNYSKGSLALKRLKEIVSVLNTDDFVTTNSCGLHVNISFIDQIKNRKDLVFDVNEYIDSDKILAQFGRKENSHCLDNNKTKIDIDALYDEVSENLFNMLRKNSRNSRGYFSYESFRNLKSKGDAEKFINIVYNAKNTLFLDKWIDERPAIAPRTFQNKNYLEFRMIGGKDYETKYVQIENGINDFIKAMNCADLNNSKKNNTTRKNLGR